MPTAYRQLAHPIVSLGYAAMPVDPEKGRGSKEPRYAYGWISRATEDDKAKIIEETRGWSGPDDAALWLLNALPGTGSPHLDDLDVDDLRDDGWTTDTFGVTPLTMATGRDGGGRHHLYRRDPRRDPFESGSIVKPFPGRMVDWKTGTNGYAVAPGSVHRTGRVYQLFWEGKPITAAELTVEMLHSLPVLDRDVVDRERGIGVAESDYVELGFDRSTTRLRVYQGGGASKYPKCKAPTTDLIPIGAWKGVAVEAVAARIISGETGLACPHAGRVHRTDLAGGETARLHVEAGAPAYLVCFACSTT